MLKFFKTFASFLLLTTGLTFVIAYLDFLTFSQAKTFGEMPYEDFILFIGVSIFLSIIILFTIKKIKFYGRSK